MVFYKNLKYLADEGAQLRILHVTPAYYPATHYGGPIMSTFGLCNALQGIPGIDLRVLTTDAAGPNKVDRLPTTSMPIQFPAGYPVYYCPRSFGNDVSLQLLWRLPDMLRWADVVHLTGVYSMPTIPVLLGCRLRGKPLVWSPRGSFQRWGRSTRRGLKASWEAVCNQLVQPARSALHVTSQTEAEASAFRVPGVLTALIPNGVDLPVMGVGRRWRPEDRLRVLYLGRLHPIKGIENLLDALSAPAFTEMPLTLCGEGEPAYKAELERRVQQLGMQGRVFFAGHVSSAAKHDALANADICVLPSHSENFGMTVAEALAHGVPVIVSKGAPWSGVEEHGCGLWVENTPVALAAALQEITSRDLAAMGQRGRAWMERDFGWGAIASRMHDLYASLEKD